MERKEVMDMTLLEATLITAICVSKLRPLCTFVDLTKFRDWYHGRVQRTQLLLALRDVGLELNITSLPRTGLGSVQASLPVSGPNEPAASGKARVRKFKLIKILTNILYRTVQILVSGYHRSVLAYLDIKRLKYYWEHLHRAPYINMSSLYLITSLCWLWQFSVLQSSQALAYLGWVILNGLSTVFLQASIASRHFINLEKNVP